MKVNNHRIKFGRITFLILAGLLALCIITQFYFAGVAIFSDASAWMKHMTFVHVFGFNLPIFMLIFAIIGALPRWAYWQLFGVMLSIFLMYFTANFKSEVPWVGPMHVMVAICLFVLSLSIVLKSWNLIFNHTKTERSE